MKDPETLEICGQLLVFWETTDMSGLLTSDPTLAKQNISRMLVDRLNLEYEHCVESRETRILRSHRAGCADVENVSYTRILDQKTAQNAYIC